MTAKSEVRKMIDDMIRVHEGGYINHTSDKGGETIWGITKATAKAHGYTGDLRLMPRERAVQIYEKDYWLAPKFDQVAKHAPKTALQLFDYGVNSGPRVAAEAMQRRLNTMNQRGRLWADIVADGLIGPKTLEALKACVRHARDGDELLAYAINCQRGDRFSAIAERNTSQEDFIWGWLRRGRDLARRALA